jgi:hypothetical protein
LPIFHFNSQGFAPLIEQANIITLAHIFDHGLLFARHSKCGESSPSRLVVVITQHQPSTTTTSPLQRD